MLKKIMLLLQQWRLKQDFKEAVKVANVLTARTGKIHLVIKMDGELKVVERQRLKQLYREGKFKKGINFRELESFAIYKTAR